MADQAAAMKKEMKIKDEQITALTTQVATLTKSIETLTRTITCMAVIHAAQDGGKLEKKGGNRRPRKQIAARNIGGYCWSHGWDPVGEGHTSRNCKYRMEGHKAEETGNKKMGGSTWRPERKQYNKQQAEAMSRRE